MVSTVFKASDKLRALLVSAGEKLGTKEFRMHNHELQEIFYGIKEQKQNKDNYFLRDFVYSNSGPIPYSPILNEAIAFLQFSGDISRPYEDWQILRINQDARDYFEQEIRLNQDQRESLEKLSEQLATQLKAA